MKSYLSFAVVAALTIPALGAKPTASEFEAAAKQIVGAWRLEFTTPDDVERTPMVLVGRQHDKLVAWYIEKDKPQSFKKVRLEDDTLVLTIRPKQKKDTEVTLRARLQKDNVCVGEATYKSDDGDTGSWDFKGKRVTESDFDATEQWELNFVSPDDQEHEATVTVVAKDDQLYGWYSSKDFDIPALKFTQKDDKVVMSLNATTDEGVKVDVTFRGTIDGDQVEGEAEYNMEGDIGSFPFEGRRKS